MHVSVHSLPYCPAFKSFFHAPGRQPSAAPADKHCQFCFCRHVCANSQPLLNRRACIAPYRYDTCFIALAGNPVLLRPTGQCPRYSVKPVLTDVGRKSKKVQELPCRELSVGHRLSSATSCCTASISSVSGNFLGWRGALSRSNGLAVAYCSLISQR